MFIKENERKVDVLENSFEADILRQVLAEERIKARIESYASSAYGELFQSQKGWGAVFADPDQHERILQILRNIRSGVSLAEPAYNITERERELLAQALQEARQGSEAGEGGPFGAVVVAADGQVLAAAHNRVLIDHDPTAHAEIMAIRSACAKIASHDLQGCTLYTSCEPCPMCLSAIIWANIERVIFAGTRQDAAAIGFRDDAIFEYLAGRGMPPLTLIELDRGACQSLFAEYQQRQGQLY